MAEKYEGIKFTIGGLRMAEPVDDAGRKTADELVKAGRMLAREGLAEGSSGNLSGRVKGGFLISATAVALGGLDYARLVLVERFDFENLRMARGVGMAQPSSETPMHALIYARRRDVGAVAHVHSRRLVDEKVARALGIPITPKELPYGTREASRAALGALARDDVAVLRKHGMVAVGRNPPDAVEKVIELDRKAREMRMR